DRLFDASLGKDLRQKCGLVVHVADRPRQRRRIGLPVSRAAVDERAEAGFFDQPPGKITPQPERTETLVQKDQRGTFERPDPLRFDHAAFAFAITCTSLTRFLLRRELRQIVDAELPLELRDLL